MSEFWASGAAYEPYVGRWSRKVAREFLSWLHIPAQSRWLDVGCGTGAISQTILELTAPSAVKGVDRSEAFLQYARHQVVDARVTFDVSDAQAINEPSATYDAAISGLVLNFVPEPGRMAAEMARVTKSGGTVALYVWDYIDKMEMMRHFWNAAAALDPAGDSVDEGKRFPICQPEPLANLFRSAGLQQVETRPIDIPTDFVDFDDYWTPFLSGQAPAPRYAMSLSEERRAALRDYIRDHLPIQADGSIHLVARAWAVRGTVA
jgi:SAM-dependent methyltransferase